MINKNTKHPKSGEWCAKYVIGEHAGGQGAIDVALPGTKSLHKSHLWKLNIFATRPEYYKHEIVCLMKTLRT